MEQTTDAEEDRPIVPQTTTVDAVRVEEWPEEEAAEIARPAEGLMTTAARMEQTTDAKEDMPVVPQTTTVDAVRMEEWAEEDSDKEMEEEMIKLQIEHEEEKDKRLKRVERKRAEEDQQFLQVVSTIEMREERIKEATRLTAEARRKVREAQEDEEGWLREVIRMEEETPSSPPTQPPNQLAKMPAGKESWESVEEMRSVPDSLSGCREGVATKSNPAGATPSLTRSTIQGQAPGVARPAEGLNIITAKMECTDTAGSIVKVTNSNTVMMTKEKPEKMKSTNLSQTAKIARHAVGLIITPAKVECQATARSSVEVTNPSTVVMTQELPEKKKITIQGQTVHERSVVA